MYRPGNPPTHLVWQHDGRASADAHDRHGGLSGDEVQDLCHGLRAHVVLKHDAVNAVGGERVADAGEQRSWVGVVDQHGDGVHLQGQVHEVLSAQPAFDLCLVGGAAEHHRHVDRGHGDPEGPSRAAGGSAEQQQKQQRRRRGPPQGVAQAA